MNKNTVIAVALTFIILMVWSYYMRKNYSTPSHPSQIQFQGIKTIEPDYENNQITLRWPRALSKNPIMYYLYYQIDKKMEVYKNPMSSTTNTYYLLKDIDLSRNYYFIVKAVDSYNNVSSNTEQKVFLTTMKPKDKKEDIIFYENNVAIYFLSTLGGRIKNIVLKKFKNIHNSDKVNLIYFEDDKEEKSYPLDFQLINDNNMNKALLNDFTVYQIIKQNNKIICLSYQQNFKITKTYTFFTNKYYFHLNIRLDKMPNNSKKPDKIILKWQPVLGPVNKIDKYDKLTMGYYFLEKLKEVKIKSKEYSKSIIKNDEGIKWITFYNRYFISAIIPEENHQVKSALFYSDGKKYISGIISQIPQDQFNASKGIDYNYTVYAGPKMRDTFRKEPKLNTLESTILTQRMFFGKIINSIGNFFLDVLIFLNKLVHNFGIAIILFSIFIKIILYPLTHKQFESMVKMQKIQPVINQVREQYKNDPQKMNAELMNVYKKYKVNPFGGCLPLILQIPIFFAIWDMLQYSLELRSAKFLWINSFALPDTVGHFMGISINPLPILMGLTMILQQGQTQTDPKQKAMTYFLPLIFLIFFWNMPSGLVLYWTIQNILSVFQQMLIKRVQNKVAKEGI